jgi:hypothetical protein
VVTDGWTVGRSLAGNSKTQTPTTLNERIGDLSPADLVRLRNLRIASFSGHYGGVNEQPFKLGALIARVTETVKSAPSSAENRGVLVKVIDEHDVAVHIAD